MTGCVDDVDDDSYQECDRAVALMLYLSVKPIPGGQMPATGGGEGEGVREWVEGVRGGELRGWGEVGIESVG